MYPEKRCRATYVEAHFQAMVSMLLRLFELRVALDKLLRAASGKAHGDAPVLVIAFHSHDCSDAVAGMPHLSPQHGMRVAAAFRGGPSE